MEKERRVGKERKVVDMEEEKKWITNRKTGNGERMKITYKRAKVKERGDVMEKGEKAR